MGNKATAISKTEDKEQDVQKSSQNTNKKTLVRDQNGKFTKNTIIADSS